MHIIQYLKNRITERSTWLLFGAAISSASALPTPWSYIFCVTSMLGALVPDGKITDVA